MKVSNMLRCIDDGDTYSQGYCPCCHKVIEVYEEQWKYLISNQEEEGIDFVYSYCIFCGIKVDWRK